MAKVMDPNMLENLYSETTNYKKKIEAIADEISGQVKILSNPEILDGMRGGQGDVAINAIRNVVSSANDLVTRAKAICKFIDGKLDALAVLRRDSSGFTEAGGKARQATAGVKK